MPEPMLYLKAMAAAALVSTVMLAIAAWRSGSAGEGNGACVTALAFGLGAGYYVFFGRIAWPPLNGLERFLVFVLSAVLLLEAACGLRSVSTRVVWGLRALLAFATPRILLHGSVYVKDSFFSGSFWAVTAIFGGLTLCVWWLLLSLARRSQSSSAISVPLSVHLAILCAGPSVMMAGYIKGGAAAFPLAATLIATTLAPLALNKIFDRSRDQQAGEGVPSRRPALAASQTILGVSVVGLGGLLFVGCFFGELSKAHALTILMAPLLGWITELPRLQFQKPWQSGAARMLLVAIPLVTVLVLEKRTFDREMGPLLQHNHPALPASHGLAFGVRK